MERHLADDDVRADFHAALRAYVKTFAVALGSERFFEQTPEARIASYKADLKHFAGLRRSVQQRYAETAGYSAYEKQVRKLMDAHIQVPDVTPLTEPENIFDADAFRAEAERISASEYLHRVEDVLEKVRRDNEEETPDALRGHGDAQAYYGVLGEVLQRPADFADKSLGVREEHPPYARAERATEMALSIETIIDRRKIRDWVHNADVLQQMTDAIDDYLFELRDSEGLDLNTADMDAIIERCLDIARKRARL